MGSSQSHHSSAGPDGGLGSSGSDGSVGRPEWAEPAFNDHVTNLRATMFYVCQGSCLCGTVNNRGKVIYCYGDLVPRHGELFSDTNDNNGGATSKDLLAAQLGLWAFGIFALLIVLLLIRKSIASLRRHLEHVTDRLPMYHDDEDPISTNSTTSPSHAKDKALQQQQQQIQETNVDTGENPDMFSEDGTMTPDPDMIEESPLHIGISRLTSQHKAIPVESIRRMRLQRKDFKKGGEALRGKNVTEGFRVKEKDLKRTMK